MRVLIATTEYPPNVFGGGGVFAGVLARGLASKGHRVVVVTRGPEESVERLGRITVLRVSSPELKPRHVWFQVKALPLIRSLIERGLIDVIHVNSFSGGILLGALKRFISRQCVPAVLTVHGYPRHYLHISMHSARFQANVGELAAYLFSYPSWELLLQKEVYLADAVVAVARFIADEIRRDYGLEPSKLYYIPNAVSLESIYAETSACGSKFQDCDVAVGGRFYYAKGLHLVPLVARMLRDLGVRARFCVFGDGPYRGMVEKLAARLKVSDQLVVKGWLPHDEVLCLIKQSKVYFQPSLYEIMPITLLEAAALGKPIVALNAPYSRELVGEGFKLWLATSLRDLPTMIAGVLEDLEDVDAAQENQELVEEKYSIGRMIDSYVKLYNKLREG